MCIEGIVDRVCNEICTYNITNQQLLNVVSNALISVFDAIIN